MRRPGRILLPLTLLAAASAVACKPRAFNETDSEGGVNSVVTLDCDVEVSASLAKDFAASQDTFKEKFLSKPGCKTAGNGAVKGGSILKAGAALEKNGCKRLGRALASESSAYKAFTPNALEPRFVEIWSCGNDIKDRIYVAGPEPAFHIISPDKNGAGFGFHFYSTDPGKEGADFVYHGHSFRQATSAEYAFRTGNHVSHPCTLCHNAGSPIMKELRFPWANWQADFAARLPAFKTTDQRGGNPPGFSVPGSGFLTAEFLEREVIRQYTLINNNRVKKITGGVPVPFPAQHDPAVGAPRVKAILKPLFCESEVNIASSSNAGDVSKFSALAVPPDLFLNRLLVPQGDRLSLAFDKAKFGNSRLDVTGDFDGEDFAGTLAGVTVPVADWSAALRAFGAKHPLQGVVGQDGLFPMVVPARSFADDDYVARLVSGAPDGGAVITEKLALDVLMVDFQNPIFSAKRCSLLDAIPDTLDIFAAAKGDKGSMAANVADKVHQAIVASSVAGKADYVASSARDVTAHTTLVNDYVAGCRAKAPRNAQGVAKLVFKRLAVMEDVKNVKMLPSDPLGSKFAVEDFVRKNFFVTHNAIAGLSNYSVSPACDF